MARESMPVNPEKRRLIAAEKLCAEQNQESEALDGHQLIRN